MPKNDLFALDLGKDHDTTTYDCWCRPRVEMICPECDGDEEPAETCFLCRGEQTVECLYPHMYSSPHSLIIIHNEEAPD